MPITKIQLKKLQEIRRMASLETAQIGSYEAVEVLSLQSHPPDGVSAEDLASAKPRTPPERMTGNDYVKSRLEVYLRTWVLGAIDELLLEFGNERKKAGRR